MHYALNNAPYYAAWVQPRARVLLCITVFLLTGMPRAGVKLGPIPFYFIDIFVAATFFYALKVKANHSFRHPFSGYIMVIGFFALLGEINTVFYSGDVIRPVYSFIRTALAFSLAYSASRILQTEDDMVNVTKAAILGIGLTSLLMVFSSLPVARGLVASTVFSIPFLEPAAGAAREYAQFSEFSTRGRSLVGVSILSGAFINTFWPLIALFLKMPGSPGTWKNLAGACVFIAPFGIVMSYSRGAILGLILAVGGLFFFGSSRSRRGVIIAVICAVSVFSFVGWDSDLFYFDRVVERTNAMLNNPYGDVRESERILAYSQPFKHVLENPAFLIFGEGTSIGKTGVTAEQSGQATHAVFAQAYYSYGMVAAFTYLLMAISVLRYLLYQITRKRPPGMITPLYYQSLFAGFLGMLSWFVFGHAAVSSPRGAMLLFLLLGLIASLKNVEASEISTSYRRLQE